MYTPPKVDQIIQMAVFHTADDSQGAWEDVHAVALQYALSLKGAGARSCVM